jgi:DNA-binding beta-propeller fold protein YncE
MKRTKLAAAILACSLAHAATAGEPVLQFTKLWTHGHATPGQVAEIPAFDRRTATLWVAGVTGVDVLDAATGTLVEHIDLSAQGFVNSVAIHDGLAAFAIEATDDRRNPGSVLFYDTSTRAPAPGISRVTVGSLPDMLTFTPDGTRLLVANEGTPNPAADEDYTPDNDPPGSVSIVDVATRTLIVTAGLVNVPVEGSLARTATGMDFEPEYIAVEGDGTRAWVTLQEANALGVLELGANAFSRVIGLGAKDFNESGNEIDPSDKDGVTSFAKHPVKGIYMPDTVATYTRDGRTYTVLANEGDFREDDADRITGGSLGAAAPLDRLRVASPESTDKDTLYAAGARSFSIRDDNGGIVYDSGSILDREAAARGIYDDGRSRDKGVEPEGVALLKIKGRTYAFIGLERTTKAAVAVFDITVPERSSFVDMIVTDGDLAPEGLAAFSYRGEAYLAIANEAVAPGATTSHTTLYHIRSRRAASD